jgi:hypothetical protein
MAGVTASVDVTDIIFSTVGPLLGGCLLDHAWSLQHMFLVFAVPLLLASVCVMTLGGIVRLKVPAAAALAAKEGVAA